MIVDSVDTCYRALGAVHAVYKPMPGRFKDYIAIPRVNGYQSLHTTLFGPNGVPIEVQIRTDDMHRIAESGIAAHWKYKTGGMDQRTEQDRAREWLTNLVAMQETGSSEEFLESVKVDLFPDKVYVFTPKGEILRLPRGATVVDFAYAVHTDVGNRCVAAKVDRRLSPLRTVLRNGQTVEIVTAKGAMPNPSWVNFVVTAKARAAIRQYLKGLRRSEAIELGQRLREPGARRVQADARRHRRERDRRRARRARHAGSRRAVREDRPRRAARAAGGAAPGAAGAGHRGRGLRRRARRHDPGAPLAVAGTEGLLVTYARCCYPDPGRPDPRVPVGGPRHRRAPRDLRQRRGLPQASGELDLRGLGGRPAPHVRLGAARRGRRTAWACWPRSPRRSPAPRPTSTTSSSRSATRETSVLVFEVKVRDRRHLARIVRVIRRMPERA